MYVKKLVLDGFKSYGRRTEIEGFDPEFTAITGLNGSGKSNILDSICFVLGISNLQNVSTNWIYPGIYLNFFFIIPGARLGSAGFGVQKRASGHH